MFPPNQLDSFPAAAAAGAVYAYTIPGIKAGDPPILVTFMRPPAEVVADMARFIHKQKAGASTPACAAPRL